MNRREMLGGLASLAAAPGVARADLQSCEPCVAVHPPAPRSPHRKLRVKPVMTNMVHSDVWEGPCRFNVVTVEKEAANVKAQYARWVEHVKGDAYQFGPAVERLDPHLVLFDEAFTLPAAGLLPWTRRRSESTPSLSARTAPRSRLPSWPGVITSPSSSTG
jgi:hypothetical protein